MMKQIAIFLMAMAIIACNRGWQPGDAVNSGRDFLASAGVWNDSLADAGSKAELDFDDDGAALPHHVLGQETCYALGLNEMMGVDSAFSIVRAWGVRDCADRGVALLLGETAYSDTRLCWMATFGKDGMKDFMYLGECGGANLSYQDEIDEHTRHLGLDSMRLAFEHDGAALRLKRWVSMLELRDDRDEDSTMWSITHELPVRVNADGRLDVGEATAAYSADEAVITPYWREKRQLEVLSWLPVSDKRYCDKVNAYLDACRGTITDPALLLGDFLALVGKRFYNDKQNFMQWCCDHPDSQLCRGTVTIFKEMSPDYLRAELQKITDPALRRRSLKLIGLD